MPTSDELLRLARTFGEALQTNREVEQYRQAAAVLRADPQARDLDRRYEALYQSLVNLQRAGEPLAQEELQTFYELQAQVQESQLLQERDRKLALARGYLQNLGAQLNQKLGLDYVTLVLS
jgi:cell fate (sporulation/competence/biofilm development) regulator YlbF (YheA/YmcA/DUF963 family)